MKKVYNETRRGQGLVILIVFVAMAMTVISSAVTTNVINSVSTTRSQEGEVALNVAESGIENAMLRLLRDSSYTGETLAIGSDTATITVTGTNPKTIVSTGTVGAYKRTITVTATENAGVLEITSWSEQ